MLWTKPKTEDNEGKISSSVKAADSNTAHEELYLLHSTDENNLLIRPSPNYRGRLTREEPAFSHSTSATQVGRQMGR
jgi:hypothetical protein